MEVLGCVLDSCGSTSESWAHRREKADGKYYANLAVLRSRGSLSSRIRAWIGAPVASAMLGAETWHLTAGILHNARIWEMNRLRHMFRMKYKHGEGKMEFNMRTSSCIKNWFGYLRQDFIHLRILKTVFKAAWKEPRMQVGGEHPLKKAREVRSAMWWECIKQQPLKMRHSEKLFRASPGHISAWEDCFVAWHGSDWRTFRDTHLTLDSWMSKSAEFSNKLCDLWSLPTQNGSSRSEILASLSLKSEYNLEKLPMPDLPEWTRNFAKPSQRVLFLVDCQSAANLMNGVASLDNHQYDPLLRRSTRGLRDIWKRGWMLRRDIDNYIAWIPRECNGSADFLCNLALQNCQAYEWEENFDETSRNLLVMSDGGLKSGQGAVAWIVYEVRPESLRLLHYTCKYISVATSAFQCEMIALSEAITKVSNLICNRQKF